MKNTDKQNQMANAIRFLSIDAIEKANSGHPGLPMGAADIATVLYTKFLAHDPKKPNWPNRDRFVLSAGHGSMLLYSAMYLSGYEDVTIDEIKNFRQLGAKTAGHPEYRHINGVETTTGPLGQGIANAVGMALGERIMNARWGDLVDHYTYALVGDGCLMEGISQEAIAFAGHMKLNKLIVFWDNNHISIDGAITISDNTDQCARFEACQWNTIRVDGHDQDAIAKAIEKAKTSRLTVHRLVRRKLPRHVKRWVGKASLLLFLPKFSITGVSPALMLQKNVRNGIKNSKPLIRRNVPNSSA